MAPLIKYADSDNTKDPDSDEEKSGKGKKNDKGSNRIRRVKVTVVNASTQTVAQILWLTLMCRTMIATARESSSPNLEGQGLI